MCPPLDKTRHNNWNRKFKAKWGKTEFEVKLKWQKPTEALELKLICLQEERVCFGGFGELWNWGRNTTSAATVNHPLQKHQWSTLTQLQPPSSVSDIFFIIVTKQRFYHSNSNTTYDAIIESSTMMVTLLPPHALHTTYSLVSSLSWIPTRVSCCQKKKEWKQFHLIEELRPKQTDWAASSTFYLCFFT